MTTLLIATSNPGKVSELAAMLKDLDCQVIGFADLPENPPAIEETGQTFAENALLKAEHYHRLTGLMALADDSGLEVDALDGRPGVYSARYGGEHLSNTEQVQLLLSELKNVPVPKRTARFVCCIALVGNGINKTFESSCDGFIAYEPRGENGFGYDPVFVDAELGLTFAELSREKKAPSSHRGKALLQARQFLAEWLKS